LALRKTVQTRAKSCYKSGSTRNERNKKTAGRARSLAIGANVTAGP